MTRYALTGKRVWVAGHRGMVGSAPIRRSSGEGRQILTAGRADADLGDQAAVRLSYRWFLEHGCDRP